VFLVKNAAIQNVVEELMTKNIFYPVNRHLLVRPVEEASDNNEGEVKILLPQDYLPQRSQFVTVQILDWADDVAIKTREFSKAIVERSMIKEIEYGGEKLHIVLENYILCLVEPEEVENS
jgi:hypothetical protein